nr:asparagine synthase-related protein [Kineosporia rhizophila]
MGEYLDISPDGSARPVRWWNPPAPETSLVEGTLALREALLESVDARTRNMERISADLSGGMDSTSLSYLAARSEARLLTLRWVSEDAAGDDSHWGEVAAEGLPQAEHLVLPGRELPRWYAGLTNDDADLDGPYAWTRARSQVEYLVRQMAERGSTRHLSGDGGDELFFLTPNYLHTLVRRKPFRSIAHLRSYQAMTRASTRNMVGGLLPSPSFGEWFAQSAQGLRTPADKVGNRLDFGWGASPIMPPWATGAAVEAARAAMLQVAASGQEPLSDLRAQHGSLQDVRSGAETARRTNLLSSRHGVSWHSPFYDDRVLEAALAIRFDERADPHLYKPALAAAMRGIVPDRLLGRATKAEFSADAYAGFRKHRPELLQLCEDSELARRGLIDAEALRAAVLGLHTSSRTLIVLDGTLAAEAWLRSLTAAQQRSPKLTEVAS